MMVASEGRNGSKREKVCRHVSCNLKFEVTNLQKPNHNLQCVVCEDLVFVLRECHWFRSGGCLVHHDPEEIIELVGFNVVVGVPRELIKNRSSITNPIFCLGCSHSRGAEHGDCTVTR